MIIKNIELLNFRNYNKLKVSFYKGINIIYGKNAQGKTNLLESIYLLGLTKSHRNFQDQNLIQYNKDFLLIKGKIKENNVYTNMEVYIDNKEKKLKIDGDKVKKINNYISKMNIIIFYPEDLYLIKGSPQNRRSFLNTELSQLYSNYYIVMNEYNKLLKMRNEYLKKIYKCNNVDYNYLDIITNYLIEKAIIIYKLRYKFISRLNEKVEKIYFDIMNINNFKIKYKPNIDINIEDSDLKNKLKKIYKDKLDYDIKINSTSVGPHKDDIEFYLDDINLKLYGSQGQQRIAIVAIKLAEIEIFKKYKDSTPILLLDDIFSELDIEKQNNLLNYIKNNIQTIITTTDLSNISKKLINKSKLFKIESGKVLKIKEVKENE